MHVEVEHDGGWPGLVQHPVERCAEDAGCGERRRNRNPGRGHGERDFEEVCLGQCQGRSRCAGVVEVAGSPRREQARIEGVVHGGESVEVSRADVAVGEPVATGGGPEEFLVSLGALADLRVDVGLGAGGVGV